MTFITSDTVKNSYFLRHKKKPNLYLHPLQETKKTIQYIFRSGTTGAAIWSRKDAKAFIKSGKDPLEMVKVQDVLKLKPNPGEMPSKSVELTDNHFIIVDALTNVGLFERHDIVKYLIETGLSYIICFDKDKLTELKEAFKQDLEANPQLKNVVQLISAAHDHGKNHDNNP